MSSICFQVTCKYIFFRDAQTLVEVANYILEIYDENRHHPLCRKFAEITEKVIKYVLSFYIALATACAVSISIYSVLSGKMVLPIVYPGIGMDDIEGRILNAILQSIMCVIILVSASAFDALVTMVFVNMSMVSQILMGEINAFQELLKQEKLDAYASRQRLLTIISSHTKYNRLVKTLSISNEL